MSLNDAELELDSKMHRAKRAGVPLGKAISILVSAYLYDEGWAFNDYVGPDKSTARGLNDELIVNVYRFR